ncbi:MAG: LysM peptidoglycan-binding domain-containing protein [Anaerolineales bacterium]|nr:LysM peptidoglycan-binding domain-containing protein [Anaerolineales bacterium]
MRLSRLNLVPILLAWAALLSVTLACERSSQSDGPSFWSLSRDGPPTAAVVTGEATLPVWGLPNRRAPGAPILTPTPDNPHAIPLVRTDPEVYTVQPGDTLMQIATLYGISVEQIAQANEMLNPNVLDVGQALTIPVATPQERGPAFKVIPDSELVNGPVNILFDVEDFVQKHSGYLASYKEEVGEKPLSGAQIVESVAQDFSVSPRLLLAVLEHQSGWLSNPSPNKASQEYPIGLADPQRKGLYRQLTWAANNLNRGFYLWRVGGAGTWLLSDGSIIPIAPSINAGTAGVQQMYALLYGQENWIRAVSEEGLFATFVSLFGYPFDYAIEPPLPPGLTQPPMQLPFEAGTTWSFTGGPHGAWGDGAAWAALDFGPPGEAVGCVQSNAWVVAVADGLILRAENGAVIQDLDGDGLEQTGWVVLYMHIETRHRVQPGVYLKAGERVGHPSCEGGVSTGTHVHIARKYNGEWIPADQNVPFVLDGWVSEGAGKEYDGYLVRSGQRIEAYAGNSEINQIKR